VCDPCPLDPLNDADADTVCNGIDNCDIVFNPDQADSNSDNIGDACDCSCPCHADPACDSVTNILDVVKTADVAFRGVPSNTSGPVCYPYLGIAGGHTDVDCSGVTDIVDLVRMVNVAFRAGDPAVQFCKPCSP
jgi:hypothetical protein